MDTNTALIGLVAVVALVALALEWITRSGQNQVEHEELDARGPPGPEHRTGGGADDLPDAVRVYDVGELLGPRQLPGMEAVLRLARELIRDVRIVRGLEPNRPQAPVAILLHGPPGAGITVLVHAVARRLRARLVHVQASWFLPRSNGGSQPLIAPAVNRARDAAPSILFLDEFETLAGPEVRDGRRQRAAHDVLAESLRPTYGPDYLVIAAVTTADAQPLPPLLIRAFDHVVHIDEPELERALVRAAIRHPEDPMFRSVPVARLAERADVWRESSRTLVPRNFVDPGSTKHAADRLRRTTNTRRTGSAGHQSPLDTAA